jgi:hypothetical protein
VSATEPNTKGVKEITLLFTNITDVSGTVEGAMKAGLEAYE